MAMSKEQIRQAFGADPMTPKQAAAYLNEQALHEAIWNRGKELGLPQHQIVRAASGAQRELQRRGMTWQQN